MRRSGVPERLTPVRPPCSTGPRAVDGPRDVMTIARAPDRAGVEGEEQLDPAAVGAGDGAAEAPRPAVLAGHGGNEDMGP
jgi:hypothetical protein